jgi:hypothetical protein
MKYAPITLALCLALAACHNGKPNIQHNPQPKNRYDITLTIQDAPGPFDTVTGFMQYEIENERCIPENPIEGVRVGPKEYPSIEFTRTGDNTYVGTVYLDFLQDSDYYGLGVCHWKMTAVVAELKINEVTFSPDISSDKITTQQTETTYFSKEHLSDEGDKGSSFGGVRYSDGIGKQPEKFFSITLKAKENFQ